MTISDYLMMQEEWEENKKKLLSMEEFVIRIQYSPAPIVETWGAPIWITDGYRLTGDISNGSTLRLRDGSGFIPPTYLYTPSDTDGDRIICTLP